MPRTIRNFRPHPIALAAIAAIGLSTADAATVTWDAGAGAGQSFWDLATNWDTNALPGSADDVLLNAFDTTLRSGTFAVRSFNGTGLFTINAGSLAYTAASSVGSFAMTSGQLAGTASFLVTGNASISFGGLSGLGTSTVQGSTSLTSTGLRLDGGRTFRNEGIVAQSGSVDLNNRALGTAEAGNGAVTNAVGATWNSTGGTIFASNQGAGDTGAGATFANAGTFNRTGTGTSTVSVTFNNSGSVNVQQGTLSLTDSGAHTGNFTVAAGAILGLNGTHDFNAGTVTSPGTVQIQGGVVNFNTAYAIAGTTDINAGTLNFGANNASTGSLTQTNGQVTGTDTFVVTGAAALSFGGHSGSGTTVLQGTTALTSTGLRLDGGRGLLNQGTVNQTGNLDLNNRAVGTAEAGNGTVVNVASGVWNSTGGTTFASNQGVGDTGAGAIFSNAGTYNKTGTGTTTVSVTFNNSGTVNVQQGTLSLTDSGTHTGNFDIAAGAILGLSGTHNFNAGTVTSPGTLQIQGGVVNFNANYNIAGTTDINAGTVNFGANAANTGSLQQTNGQITGTGTLTVTGPAAISFGGHSGAGTTRVQGATSISSTGLRLDGGRILRNEGTLTQNGNVDLNSRALGTAEAGNGSVLNVNGATWAAAGGVIFTSNQGVGDTGTGAVFTNAGTFNKTGATTVTVQDVLFSNTGALNIQQGQLTFSAGGTLTHSGTLTIASGAQLLLNSATTHTINTAATTIAGTIQHNNGTLQFNGPHTISGTGQFLQTAGQVTGGNLTLGPSLATDISFGGHSGAATTTVQGTTSITSTGLRLDGGRTFRNEGALTQNGNVDLNSRAVGTAEAGNGSVLNAGGATWTAAGGVIFTTNQGVGDTGTGAVFTNAGTFNKTGATTVTVQDVLFGNTGALDIQQGQLTFNAGGTLTHSGTLTIASGAQLLLNSATTHTINTAATTIAGTIQHNNGTLQFNGPHTISGTGQFLQTAGQVTGGNLTLGPSLATDISFGGHSGAATTTVQGTASITSTGLRLDGGRIFRNEGTLTQNGNVDLNHRAVGTAEAGNGSVLNASGAAWTAAGGVIFTTNQGVGDTGTGAVFTNAGTFNKTGATTVTVQDVLFGNTGALDIQQGQLTFNAGGTLTHSGTLTIASGAQLLLNSVTTHTINTAATTIAGTIQHNNGTLQFNGPHTISGTGQFLQTAGQVTGGNLTLGPSLATDISFGGHSGAATTTVQGIASITSTGLRLDGGRVFRNEGTLTQNGNVDLNHRAVGTAEAGNGSVLNASGATWTAAGGVIFATNQGVGDTGAGAVFTNAGTFNKTGATTVTVQTGFANTGLVDSQVGALSLTQGIVGQTGTLRLSGGSVSIGAASNTGNLFHNTNTADSLNLFGQTITVFNDYNNANFGVGNSFNRRANVAVTTGPAQRLLAGGDANQGVTGPGVSNGNTTTPSIVVGNLHVGTTTYTYNIANTGTTGPSLRGAVQDAVNGGNITDTRLSGNGVVASNFGPIAPGQSEARSIVVTIGTAGVYAPISGQAVNILNNFENTRSQLLTITSAAGAGAYNLAQAGTIAPNPITLANQRVGGGAEATLLIANVAPAGSFSEALNASFGPSTGAAIPITIGTGVNLLPAGNTSSGFLRLTLDGTSAGAKTGTAQVNFASDGTGTSGLGVTALPSQTVTINGNFYNTAVGAATPSPIVIANQRVGGSGGQALTIANNAPAGLFSEALNATFGTSTGAATNNGQSIGNLAAGASELTTMNVGVTTATSGAKSGTVTINFQSDGTGNGNSGLSAIDAGSQTINVSGNVYQLAAGQLNTAPLNFGTVQVGQTVSRTLSITNSATGATGFVEDLNAQFGATSGTGAAKISGTGSITGLVAGATNDGSMTVNVNTSAAGTINGAIAVNYTSAGTVGGVSNGLGQFAVGSSSYGVAGTVISITAIDQAQPVINTPTINLGNVRIGSASPTQFVNITNQATGNQQAALNASIGANAPITASGSFNLLAPGATNNTALQVGMSTANAGAISGTATIALVSDANNVGNCAPDCQVTLVSQNVNVSGNVFRLATGSAQPTPIAFGNLRIGGAAQQVLSVANTAANDSFSERLNASFGTSTGSAVTTTGAVNQLQAGVGADASMSVTLNTATAGAKSGTVTLNYASDGTGTTGAPVIANGSQVISFSGGVYQVAQPSFAATNFNLGNVRVGGTVLAGVGVTNTLNAPAGFQEGLVASIGGATGGITATGSIANLAAGSSAANALVVGIDTTTSGAKSGSATVSLASTGAGTSGLADLALPSQLITVSGNVYQLAAGQLNTAPLTFTAQVGQSVSQVLSITNSATGATGFVEDLNVRFGSASGTGAGRISGTGSITGLAAGGTNNSALTVNVDTSTVGSVSGAIAVDFFSAGTVGGTSNGFGELGVGSVNYGVVGNIDVTVINRALPVLNTPSINLGNVRIGSASPTQFVSLTNQAGTPPQAALNASITGNAPITASGSFDLLAPGATNSGSLQVGMNTSTAGAIAGTATIALVSDASNVGNCAPNCQLTLPSQTVDVTGAVYRLANPVGPSGPIILAGRVGDASPQAFIGITNASPDAFTERLNANIVGAPAGFTTSGSISGLAAGASSTALGVSLNTSTAGTFGGQVGVAFVSSGAGTTGAPDLALPTQNFGVAGRVYTPAVGQVSTTTVDFGIVHKGDAVAARNVAVTNGAASTALNDTLAGSLGGAIGPFTAGGAFTGLAAGSTDTTSFGVTLDTTNAGVFDGSASAAFASRNPDLADLALGAVAVTLKGQVNNFAELSLGKVGGAGGFTQSGNAYTLDFGNVLLGSVDLGAALAIFNTAVGPADLLSGSFTIGSGSGFTLGGFDSFSGIAAGASLAGLTVGFGSSVLGEFTQTITLAATGSNASGFEGALATTTLVLHGNVVAVPEPGTYLLFASGILALWFVSRRKLRTAAR